MLKSKIDGTPAEFRDPFSKECVQRIWFNIFKNWKGVIQYTANVEFRNGNTKGEQDFTADDFPSLVKKVEDFIKML